MSTAMAEATVADTRVVGVERLGGYQVLTLRAPAVARHAIPGQFVMLSSGALLCRPFSVYRAEEDSVAVAFDVIGEGTRWLAARTLGDALTITGPLGTGFTMDHEGPVVAVGGGYGAAPLFLLAERLRPTGARVHAILGAAGSSRVFGKEQAERAFDSVRFTTEDGSLGTRGFVTDVLAAVVASTGATRIAACGPMPMLEAVSAGAAELGVPCEIAVEEFMACGIGVCWTCVLPIASGDGEPRYDRSCTEGPVVDAAKVVWG